MPTISTSLRGDFAAVIFGLSVSFGLVGAPAGAAPGNSAAAMSGSAAVYIAGILE